MKSPWGIFESMMGVKFQMRNSFTWNYTQTQMLNVWPIYLHLPYILGQIVGKYTSPIKHLGKGKGETSTQTHQFVGFQFVSFGSDRSPRRPPKCLKVTRWSAEV